jgi:hypothetical protein
LFKSKKRITLQVEHKDKEHVFIPDFMGNLERDPDDQLRFILRRLSNTDRIKTLIKVGDGVEQDLERTLRLGISRVENPPIIQTGSEERDMSIDDLVELQDLYLLSALVFTEIVKFNEGTIDPKKS